MDISRNNIRAARMSAGLSQGQLAKKLDVSRNYIVQIESGKKGPSLRMVEAIANVTGAKISQLLAGDPIIERIREELIADAEHVLDSMEANRNG